MTPKVSIIILNWNGWEDTLECLESIYQINYNNYNVILVDNDSEDNSIQTIKEYANGEIEIKSKFFKYTHDNKPIEIMEYSQREYEELKQKEYLNLNNKVKDSKTNKLIIIKNEKNYGFAEGNNIGIKFAQKLFDPDYFLLLNNDTVVEPNFLKELVEFADTDEKIGIVGPKIYYYNFKNKDNYIWSAGGEIHLWRELIYSHVGINEEDLGQFDAVKEVEWVSGAALLLKTNANIFKNLECGVLNNNYFFGTEDVELCIKTRKTGLKIFYVFRSKIWHKVGTSREKKKIKTRNFVDYFRLIKHNFSLFFYIYHLILFFILILPKLFISFIINYRNPQAIREFIRYNK